MRATLTCLLAIVPGLGGLLVQPAEAAVFLGQKQALEWAFPTADRIDKKTWILSAAQAEAISERSRTRLATKLVKLYTAWQGGEIVGYAHIDVHEVRTKQEALLVVLKPDGVVRSVRVLAFHEPPDYLPTDRWYEQFEGKSSGESIRTGHDVYAVVGATLSARAASGAVRRMLAYWEVLLNDRMTDE